MEQIPPAFWVGQTFGNLIGLTCCHQFLVAELTFAIPPVCHQRAFGRS